MNDSEYNNMNDSDIMDGNTVQADDAPAVKPLDFFEQVEDDPSPAPVSEEVRRKANKYFLTKVLINLVLIIVGAVAVGVFLRQMQMQTAIVKQEEISTLALEETVQALEENSANAKSLTEIYHKNNQEILGDMSQLFSSGLFDSLIDADNKTRSEVFGDLVERSGIEYLFIMDMRGKIAISGEPSLYGVNPADRDLMTKQNVKDLVKGSVRSDGSVAPIEISNQYGSFYFYSMPYKFAGREYRLVLGADSSILDVQISSLKDVSVVLSRAAIGKGGFMFAVDPKDGNFIYYKNGDEVLTGQNAVSLGLTEEAMKDGYKGLQTINGVRYYCVSRTCGDKTVICAVTDQGKIVANDRHVLFWSITGFILVLLICLAYAVIIRNNFVRNEVKTERRILNPDSENPVYFDKTVFSKVLPLMLTGVLVMFGISFYTQTLLEITEGVEKSNVALDEVAGRYEESQDNRDVIRNYYNNRFLSKANLISFLIEENPSVLNANSEKHHSYYDKDGNRIFLRDDEGNILKSVSSSPRLQELCDKNSIKSVYIFDEDGHTIGTNTDKWFFSISHDEEAQSYPFLQVLDGRAESYIQEPMTDDMGDSSQYIGVPFNYYTRKDADGDTVYVSRFEYENADDRNSITRHTSMIQIGLDSETSEKLLDSTDVGNVLSTNMLSGGAIVMFDTSEDHLCVYSPIEVSIGKSAKELGVSDKAFSGLNYYGFSRVNDVDYFTCFQYREGYFIGTALPESEMYKSRILIALVTALISFLVVLILSGTVTLTTREEESLYATMSEAQTKKGLDSAIFNIILPSGRQSTTVKASSRWDNKRIPWSEKSPEQKLMTLIGVAAALLMIYIILAVINAKTLFDDDSIIRYIISGTWDRGSNIFALSSCAMVLITIFLGIALIRIPIRLTTVLLGARGETIGHLLISVIKYGGALFGLFYCLYLLGIDSSRLLASAGILSLIIGLGAQSLIKDILAGIFIVFEGEFRVGDIVTINGYRGTVMDIGLRTTKILGSDDSNIKIYNNSEISGILNMTQQTSYAFTKICIEYGQDIEYVEEVLGKELPRLHDDNPKIVEGPTYYGVSALKDSGVELLILSLCAEKDVKAVTRYLNREILQIFYKYKINVPFPNITLSTLNEDDRKIIDDLIRPRKDDSIFE